MIIRENKRQKMKKIYGKNKINIKNIRNIFFHDYIL